MNYLESKHYGYACDIARDGKTKKVVKLLEKQQELVDMLVAERAKTERLDAALVEKEKWIEIAGGIKCPNCDDEGFKPVQDNYGGWEQEQCQFCYECQDSIFSRKARAGK